MRSIEAPTATEHDRGTEYRHPAYGSIQLFRSSGSQVLHGSDFNHQHFMTLRIVPAYMVRGLSNDWHHPRLLPHVEIAMSEAQWATLVSSVGVGSGVPCTVTQLGGELVPGLPPHEPRTSQFRQEATRKLEGARQRLADLGESLAESKIPAKERVRIQAALNRVEMELGANLEFVAKQFDEHMEKTVERAKVEINAYATSTLGANARPVISHEPTEPQWLTHKTPEGDA